MKPLSLAFLLLSAPLSARTLTVTASAYHGGPCKRCGTGRRTATGHSAASPGLAVDPRFIRLGSRVRILSRGFSHVWRSADDTGGRIKGRRIDLRLGSHAAAQRFGVRRLLIEIRSAKRRKR
jgi:3D (Asp-Asp-Asp) domain-containing protein